MLIRDPLPDRPKPTPTRFRIPMSILRAKDLRRIYAKTINRIRSCIDLSERQVRLALCGHAFWAGSA
jgi:hypothetical protein